MNKAQKALCIQTLNDEFRKAGEGGHVVITQGIQEMGWLSASVLRRLVAEDDAFSEDNDPHGEHDFGSLTFQQQKVFWKIDYYDTTLTAGSPDPADPAVTTRVLTIMLAHEY